jgi:glycosyltransferase involved in cell wall biosynthesis
LKAINFRSPLVSVIIPNFNYGHFLAQAIASVATQSYSNWEIVVVDNFSSDNSEEICRQLNYGSKLIFIKHSNHGILASARNVGIRAASGELIAFLDSDDLWYSRKLQEAVDAYLDGADVTYHSVRLIGPELRHTLPFGRLRSRQIKSPAVEDLLLKGNGLVNSSVVVPKLLIEKFGYLDESPHMAGAEDLNMWLKLSTFTEKFLKLPGFLGAYRSHSNSFSNSQPGKMGRNFAAIESFLSTWPLIEKRQKGLSDLITARLSIFNESPELFRASVRRALARGSLEVKSRAFVLLLLNFKQLFR